MQTQLADFIRDTPEGREADAILRKCVHCGFCTATCPTYQLLGDELDGPRGRIYLVKQMLEGETPTAKTQLHLDRCLSCRSCETTCPSGVQYGRLADIGRGIVEQKVGRGAWDRVQRAVLCAVLPRTGLFSFLLSLGRIVPAISSGKPEDKDPGHQGPAGAWPAPRHARRMLVLAGCVQPALAPRINAAAARVLDRAGISLVEAPGAGCCGALRFHLNDQEAGRADMRALIDAWWPAVERGEVEAIVMTASGCGSFVKEFAHHFQEDPAYREKAAANFGPYEGSFRGRSGKGRAKQRQASTRRLPVSLLAAAWPAAARQGRGAAGRGGLRADAGRRRPPVLRLGGHLLDPAAGAFRPAA